MRVMQVKHNQRVKMNQCMDQLEKSSFHCLLELKNTMNHIIGTIKDIECSKEITPPMVYNAIDSVIENI